MGEVDEACSVLDETRHFVNFVAKKNLTGRDCFKHLDAGDINCIVK